MPAPMLTFAPIVASPRYARWVAFDPAPEHGLLQLDEVADAAPSRARRLRRAGARTARRARRRATCDSVIDAVVEDRSTPVAEPRVDDARRRCESRSRRRSRVWPSSVHAGVDDVSAPTVDVRHRCRSSPDRRSSRPAAISSSFFVAHDSAHVGQLAPAVDAANLVGIRRRVTVSTPRPRSR